MKESVWRAKRLTREMQAFWKQADRVERENKKRREKEAEEQRKLKEEIMEAKRKQRNLNFIITQTELYSYLMSRRLSKSPVSEEEESRILSQLKEAEDESLSGVEGYDE
jgi:DNA helicase INO80